MDYVVPGEILARLLVVAGQRLDADEVGEMVHRVKPLLTELRQADLANFETAGPVPPAKPET